jgi:hypothetical protein
MLPPLYAARIEDLGPGDFVKVDCAACHHVALLTPKALLGAGLRPSAKLLDLLPQDAGADRRDERAGLPGSPAHAAARLRLQAGERWSGHPRATTLPRPPAGRYMRRRLSFGMHGLRISVRLPR